MVLIETLESELIQPDIEKLNLPNHIKLKEPFTLRLDLEHHDNDRFRIKLYGPSDEEYLLSNKGFQESSIEEAEVEFSRVLKEIREGNYRARSYLNLHIEPRYRDVLGSEYFWIRDQD